MGRAELEVALVVPEDDEEDDRDGEESGDVGRAPLRAKAGQVGPTHNRKRVETHPVRRALSVRQCKRQQRHGARNESTADPIDRQALVFRVIGRDEEERRDANQSADTRRDEEDGAPGDGGVLRQAVQCSASAP